MLSTTTSSTDHSNKDCKTIQFNAVLAITGATEGNSKERLTRECIYSLIITETGFTN